MGRLLNLGNRIVNNWLYESPGGFVLIDTGYQRLRRKLTGHRIPLTDIRYIFLTRASDDILRTWQALCVAGTGAQSGQGAEDESIPLARAGLNYPSGIVDRVIELGLPACIIAGCSARSWGRHGSLCEMTGQSP